MTIQDIQKTSEAILTTLKKQRHKNDTDGLIETGIASLEYAGQLIPMMVDSEHKYRVLEKESVLTPMAQGKAETIAKASEEYRDWRHCVALYDTLNEISVMAKKLVNTNTKEFNSI